MLWFKDKAKLELKMLLVTYFDTLGPKLEKQQVKGLKI